MVAPTPPPPPSLSALMDPITGVIIPELVTFGTWMCGIGLVILAVKRMTAK